MTLRKNLTMLFALGILPLRGQDWQTRTMPECLDPFPLVFTVGGEVKNGNYLMSRATYEPASFFPIGTAPYPSEVVGVSGKVYMARTLYRIMDEGPDDGAPILEYWNLASKVEERPVLFRLYKILKGQKTVAFEKVVTTAGQSVTVSVKENGPAAIDWKVSASPLPEFTWYPSPHDFDVAITYDKGEAWNHEMWGRDKSKLAVFSSDRIAGFDHSEWISTKGVPVVRFTARHGFARYRLYYFSGVGFMAEEEFQQWRSNPATTQKSQGSDTKKGR